MDAGTFLLVAGVLLIIFSGLVAFQVLPGLTAKMPGGVDVSLSTSASRTIPGTTLPVRSALLIGWFGMGCVLTVAGLLLVMEDHSLTVDERQQRLTQLMGGIEPDFLIEQDLSKDDESVAFTSDSEESDPGLELFYEALDLANEGRDDEAVESYEAALNVGLSDEFESFARLEIGLIHAFTIPDIQDDPDELQRRCDSAFDNLVEVLDSSLADFLSEDDLSTAEYAFDLADEVCPL